MDDDGKFRKIWNTVNELSIVLSHSTQLFGYLYNYHGIVLILYTARRDMTVPG
jgi:hypothetical protein